MGAVDDLEVLVPRGRLGRLRSDVAKIGREFRRR